MTSQTSETSTYKAAAIALHWLIAGGIIFQVGWGWYMDTLARAPAHEPAEHLHISIGLTLLVLIVLRVAIRLFNPPPPLPAGMPGWEAALSKLAHVLFYVLMLAIPLVGWAMESQGPRPIPFWGQEWPHMPIPGLSGMPREQSRPLHETLQTIHGSVLAWIMIALFALHVLGALKHQFDGHPVLYRILPFLKPKAT